MKPVPEKIRAHFQNAARLKVPEDPDAKFKAEYLAAHRVYARFGITEEAYVASRRKDEGIS